MHPTIMIGVKTVQEQLPKYWTDQSYPESFNIHPLLHRHFNHALIHSMKATGSLAALADKLDHNGEGSDQEEIEFRTNAGKYLADLVICAARMSEQLEIDLDENVQYRINTLIQRWGGK